MADPVDLLIQGAIVALLKADAPVGALVADRIYDQPPDARANPDGLVFPYITASDSYLVDDTNSCSVMDEVFTQIHVWSRDVGKAEARRIAGAVRDALRPALTVAGHVISEQQHVTTRFMTDPDGVTKHAVIEHRFLTNPST